MLKASLLFSLVLLFVFAVNADIVDFVNNQNAGWTARHNPNFAGRTYDSLKPLMGTKLENRKRFPYSEDNIVAVPDSFDARQQWPNCIGGVRDQGECGSCWAFGCVEALGDRFCIHSTAGNVTSLAALDPTACDRNDQGCEGGYPEDCWDYAMKTGIVDEQCIPYNDSIPTCGPENEPCLKFVNTPKCPNKCSNGQVWSQVKSKAKSAYAVKSNVAAIQSEIYTNGPVEAAFEVYADFVHYSSGVYKHTTGQLLGGHAIKIIGWGELSGTPYWLVQNSWTTTWGADGYFMILRGSDECGIEDGVVAGLPDTQ